MTMRDEAPVDEVESVVVNDSQSSQEKLIKNLQQQITNMIDQNKLLRKENCDLQSDLRLEVAAYKARKAEVDAKLEMEVNKMNEEKWKFEERIASLLKENQRLKDSMILKSEARAQVEKVNTELRTAQGKVYDFSKENRELKACITGLQKTLDEERDTSVKLKRESEKIVSKMKLESEKTRTELINQITQHMKQIDELNDRKEHDAEAKTKLQEKISSLIASHEAACKEIKDEWDKEVSSITSSHEKKYSEMKTELEERIVDTFIQNIVVLI